MIIHYLSKFSEKSFFINGEIARDSDSVSKTCSLSKKLHTALCVFQPTFDKIFTPDVFYIFYDHFIMFLITICQVSNDIMHFLPYQLWNYQLLAEWRLDGVSLTAIWTLTRYGNRSMKLLVSEHALLFFRDITNWNSFSRNKSFSLINNYSQVI